MFLTLCYAFLTVVIQRQRRRLADLLNERLGCGTVLFHKNKSNSVSKFTDGEIKISKILLEKDEKRVTLLIPKQKINLTTWNRYKNYNYGQLNGNFATVKTVNILFEVLYAELNEKRERSLKNYLNVEEFCIPMAWRSNEVFGILVKSSVEDLNLLGAAFLNDQLRMNEGKEIHKMMTVDVEGTPIDIIHQSNFPLSPPSSWSSCLIQSDSTVSTPIIEQIPELCEKLLVEGGADNNIEEDFLHAPIFASLETIEQQEYCDTYGGSNESLAENVISILDESLSDSDTSLNEDIDSLCSQLSNEGEAASHSSSPKKLVDSIYCNLDNSIDEFEEAEEYCAGEAMAEGSFSPIPDLDEIISNNIPKTETPCKPPNILIYTGEYDSASSTWFKNIKENLYFCLKPNCYTIYLLTPTQVNQIPWRENTELLIVSCDDVNQQINNCFSAFVVSGGKLLNFCSNLELFSCMLFETDAILDKSVVKMKYKEWNSISVMHGKFRYRNGLLKKNFILGTNEDNGDTLIKVIHSQNNSGITIMSQVHLEVDPDLLTDDTNTFLYLKESNILRVSVLRDILSVHLKMNCDVGIPLQLTPCYLFTKEKLLLEQFISEIRPKLCNNELKYGEIILQFNVENEFSVVTENILPVICNSSIKVPFDVKKFYSNLKTKLLGRVLLYIDVIPTTMKVLKGLINFEGCIAIARYQTRGRGRGKNQWLSPEGCASFTLHASIPLSSKLGQSISFLQHLVSVSLIEAVTTKTGYENIELSIKWPNDIYYNKMKIGGIIVDSSIEGETIHCFIGCGINVANNFPTICVNDVIKIYNGHTNSSLSFFSVEEYISIAVTRLEMNIDKYQKEGSKAILPVYYKYWLHSGQKMILNQTKEEVVIIGLDEHGYLQVKNSSGNIISLHSDGNSLDMMQNLILLKT